MKQLHVGVYPENWGEIALGVKKAANWTCVRCGQVHDTKKRGAVLTVHHLDCDKGHSDPARYWWNLVPLCQRCHLSVQGRVVLARPWAMQEHSDWFKPYVAGWYAAHYLSLWLDRPTVMAHLNWLVRIEPRIVRDGARRDTLRIEWERMLYVDPAEDDATRGGAPAGAPAGGRRRDDARGARDPERGDTAADGPRRAPWRPPPAR